MRSLILLAFCTSAVFAASPLPPPDQQQLAHDIYKQLIEIKSGYTSGENDSCKNLTDDFAQPGRTLFSA